MVVYSQCVLERLMYIPNFFCTRGEMQIGALNQVRCIEECFPSKAKKMFDSLPSHFTVLRHSLFIDMLNPLYSVKEI